jgi:hypothetical protein
MTNLMSEASTQFRDVLDRGIKALQTEMSTKIDGVRDQSSAAASILRQESGASLQTFSQSLAILSASNEAKLEQIRTTVDGRDWAKRPRYRIQPLRAHRVLRANLPCPHRRRSRFTVHRSAFEVWGLGFEVRSLEFGVWSSEFGASPFTNVLPVRGGKARTLRLL